MRTFFYIITKDKQIFEIENIGDRFASSFDQWQKGGLIIFPSLGMGISGNDVSKILLPEQYDNYIDTSQPKMYIKNGAWYDIKDRTKAVRIEKWRQNETDEKKRLMLENNNHNVNQEQIKGWIAKYRPKFLEKSKPFIAK